MIGDCTFDKNSVKKKKKKKQIKKSFFFPFRFNASLIDTKGKSDSDFETGGLFDVVDQSVVVSCFSIVRLAWPGRGTLSMKTRERERESKKTNTNMTTVDGLVMTMMTRGFKSFAVASFSDRWHLVSVGVWLGNAGVSHKSRVPSPSPGWSFSAAVLRN